VLPLKVGHAAQRPYAKERARRPEQRASHAPSSQGRDEGASGDHPRSRIVPTTIFFSASLRTALRTLRTGLWPFKDTPATIHAREAAAIRITLGRRVGDDQKEIKKTNNPASPRGC